jgi:cytochrome c biogenesis protein CcmG/thiol:disulfide interchange protein DsbE
MTMLVQPFDASTALKDAPEVATMTRERWMLCGIAALAAGLAVTAYPTLEQRMVNPGDAAPAFSVKTEQGLTITPKDFRARVLVLNFWASWCQPCVQEFGDLNKFAQDMAGQGVVVVGVSADRSEKAYRRFLESYRPSFQTSRDPDADVAASFGTFAFPETYVIDKDGKVVKKIVGVIDDWDELRTLVKSL